MSGTRARLFLAAGLVIATAAGIAVWKRGQERSAGIAAGVGVLKARPRPPLPAPFIRGAVLVNQQRAWRSHTGVALVIEASLRNPLDEPAVLRDPARLTVQLTREDGAAVHASVENAGERPSEIAARGVAMIAWIVPPGLPAGKYRVGVHCAIDTFASKADAPCGRLTEAALEIVEGAAPAEEVAYAQAQVLSRRGDAAGALALIEATVRQNPDALLMRLWLADALRDQGRAGEADAEYARLAAESLTRQRASGVAAPQVPFWLAHAAARVQ